ncbi:hypothetical protein QQG74_03460 [Micromonospora sp. FIMYZ51]|uniref:hypothetical protein n=1 Tax=Micromonospora sp. FIMYZ51 TaxID=3051832 RepID=UPI00311EB43A
MTTSDTTAAITVIGPYGPAIYTFLPVSDWQPTLLDPASDWLSFTDPLLGISVTILIAQPQGPEPLAFRCLAPDPTRCPLCHDKGTITVRLDGTDYARRMPYDPFIDLVKPCPACTPGAFHLALADDEKWSE